MDVAQERTEGVVLRGIDFSETSRIVTFLTPDRGRLACMAKGVRRKNSPREAVLDTLNRVELVYYWKAGRAVQLLAEASLLDGFGAIKKELAKNTFAMFPLEIAAKVAHEDEPSEELYATLVRGMEALGEWPGEARTHVCWQAFRLLCAAGFEPSLDMCCVCGKSEPNTPGFSYDGGIACRACRPDGQLSSGEWAALRQIAASRDRCPPFAHLRQGVVTPCPLAAVYEVLHRYAARQLETDLRSVRVIEDMFGLLRSGTSGRSDGLNNENLRRKQE